MDVVLSNSTVGRPQDDGFVRIGMRNQFRRRRHAHRNNFAIQVKAKRAIGRCRNNRRASADDERDMIPLVSRDGLGGPERPVVITVNHVHEQAVIDCARLG